MTRRERKVEETGIEKREKEKEWKTRRDSGKQRRHPEPAGARGGGGGAARNPIKVVLFFNFPF